MSGVANLDAVVKRLEDVAARLEATEVGMPSRNTNRELIGYALWTVHDCLRGASLHLILHTLCAGPCSCCRPTGSFLKG